VQRFGTGRVGFCFAPIVLIYFLCNLIIAITNISRYKPDIFKVNSLCAAKHWRFCDKYALANCMGPSAVTRSACIELCCWYCGKGSKMAESPTCCNFAHCECCPACSNQVRNNLSKWYRIPCLQALSPHYAYYYFRDNHHLGWLQCSGLFLAVTGSDSMPVVEDDMCWLMQLLFCIAILCCVNATYTEVWGTHRDWGHIRWLGPLLSTSH